MVVKHQLMFVQCDKGVHTYRNDNLAIQMAIEGAIYKVTLKAVRGW